MRDLGLFLDFKLFNSDRCKHVAQRRRDTRGNTTLILPGLVIIEVTAVKSGAVKWVVEFSCALRSAAWLADTCANSCRLDFGVHDPPTAAVITLIEAEQHDFGQGFGCQGAQCQARKFIPALDVQLAQLVTSARQERNTQELAARQAKTALAVSRMHASRDKNLQAKRQKSAEAAAAARQRERAILLGAAAAQQGTSESPAANPRPEPSSVKPECPGDIDVDSGNSGDDDTDDTDADAPDDATTIAAVLAAAKQAQEAQVRVARTQAAMARAQNGGCLPAAAAVLNVLGGHF